MQRRNVLQLAAIGAGSTLGGCSAQRSRLLTEKDRFDLGGRQAQVMTGGRAGWGVRNLKNTHLRTPAEPGVHSL
jgi:hypothetical protein